MKYYAPEYEALLVETEDIILASGGNSKDDGTGGTVTPDEEL